MAFLILSYLELKVVGDLARYQDLVLAFAVLSALFCVTIVLQALKRGFDGQPAYCGEAWYAWLNAVVTAVFAIAVLVARRRG